MAGFESGGGNIINIGSIIASRAMRSRSAYVTSKGAVESMTRALAVELAGYGIRVNSILPGYVYSDRWEELSDEDRLIRRANLPLGKEATPGDIGQVVAFLVGEGSSKITGAMIPVTSGFDVQFAAKSHDL